jgi:hypothetical protein
LFNGIEHKGAEEQPDEESPFVLTTGPCALPFSYRHNVKKKSRVDEKVPGA